MIRTVHLRDWQRWVAAPVCLKTWQEKSHHWGRGNLSFTTLNMPRLAIEARIKAENLIEDERNTAAIEQKAKEIFIESVHSMAALVADQLYERYQYQRTALARQFPFMMGNNVWKGGADLNPNEQVGDVLRSGTLGIGFIGGHNAMVALYGEGHLDTAGRHGTRCTKR